MDQRNVRPQSHPHQYTLLYMAHYLPNTDILNTGKLRHSSPSRDSQHPRYIFCPRISKSYQLSKTRPTGNRSRSTLVHILDDDSLFIIFSFCRPVILDESEADVVQILGGGEWNRERWWHRLIQVCRRWRYLVLESAFHLQVSLVCAHGTPVADMMAHSPPVPLIIDHFDERQDLTAEDEEGILFALQHRARVRRIRLMKPVSTLQKLVKALDGEFPILEFLFIQHQRYHRPVMEYETNLELPETFRAPRLRQLVLKNFATPIESPSLKTMGHLVTLTLGKIPSSAYFHPDALLQWLSLLPQLETLWIGFNFSRVVEEQLLLLTPSMTRVTLPNLHWFGFRGSSTYGSAPSLRHHASPRQASCLSL